MSLPKVFKFRLKEGMTGSEVTFHAEYANELPKEYAYGDEVGEKGYIISWFEDGDTERTTYLEHVAEYAVSRGKWIIIE